MVGLSLTVAGQTFGLDMTPEEAAALDALLAARNGDVAAENERSKDTAPKPFWTSASYLEHVLTVWVSQFPTATMEDIQATARRALASWAGRPPDPPVNSSSEQLHAVVRKSDNAVLSIASSLPFIFRVDGGGAITFAAPGGLETSEYICLKVVDQAEPEPRTHRRVGEPALARDASVVRREWAIEGIPVSRVRAEAEARLDKARIKTAMSITAGPESAPAKIGLYTNKFLWAMNHLLGNTIDDEKLRPEATARGITLTQLAMLIKAKGDAATAGVAEVEGHYATASALIAAAPTAGDIIAAEDAGIAAIEAVA